MITFATNIFNMQYEKIITNVFRSRGLLRISTFVLYLYMCVGELANKQRISHIYILTVVYITIAF